MGLTKTSTGKGALDIGICLKTDKADYIVSLAGNPNVGKSTIFNALTHGSQHTGNWPGKTVASAAGICNYKEKNYLFVDLPGTYSLMSHSNEEEIARDFICFVPSDAVVVVCDATCLERNLNLVLQAIEIVPNVIVCVNLLDEAKKKGILIQLEKLEQELGVPVAGTCAREKKGLEELLERICRLNKQEDLNNILTVYSPELENKIAVIQKELKLKIESDDEKLPFFSDRTLRWISIKLIEGDKKLLETIQERFNLPLLKNNLIMEYFPEKQDEIKDELVSGLVKKAEEISEKVIKKEKSNYWQKERKIDQILTGKITGLVIMLLLLCFVFWLTISAANVPSDLLAKGLFWVQDQLLNLFSMAGAPGWLSSVLILGVYRVLAWVISVMLPPMMIFFPLFTLLEDSGYLPRIAYNLDHCFKKCSACGKQALTMCMGFGCNAAGVVGCRIIDSKRERLIAILTNNFVPCNGRFPTLIAIITMFFVGSFPNAVQSMAGAVLLVLVILFGVGMTLIVSKVLSVTILKGIPSSFTLELPPYRKPQIGTVILRSIFDRTLFVLGRAVVVAAPAGLIIWLLANVSIGGQSILISLAGFLDPFGHLLGMDGVILLGFLLGFPANEIVLPVIIMAYMSSGTLVDISNLDDLRILLVQNGWTYITAISVMLFSMVHWPCSTACLTIRKETGSLKWMGISILIPTLLGMLLCFSFHTIMLLLGLV